MLPYYISSRLRKIRTESKAPTEGKRMLQPKIPEDPGQSTRMHQPIILIRGFGGLGVDDEKGLTYQGFNDGTVYPHKRGENYIYEGMVLRFLKSDWRYFDTTNVVGYYGESVPPIGSTVFDHPEFKDLKQFFDKEDKVVFDPGMILQLVRQAEGESILKTIWVFRYYDLNDRDFGTYAKALVRLIEFIRQLSYVKSGAKGIIPKVNIIAHSMGGLIVREAIQTTLPALKLDPAKYVNKIVTLGTPHQGISFQILGQLKWLPFLDAAMELAKFSPEEQAKEVDPGYKTFKRHFPLSRLLTVVGTNYRSYSRFSSFLNRMSPLNGEFGLNYNRSDGLVKQTNAQIPGAPRTFVNKCHGGEDSVVTSRESFEIATRFFFGDIHVKLTMSEAEISRGFDIFGKSEFFLGMSVKPRGVDFELFHQSSAAENAYGPFTGSKKGTSLNIAPGSTGWQPISPTNPDMLIWEGYLDTRRVALPDGTKRVAEAHAATDLAMRLDFFVGERDLLGLGFSDNIVFRKQYYVQAKGADPANGLNLYLYTSESFSDADLNDPDAKPMEYSDGKWKFEIGGTGFNGTFKIELAAIPEVGDMGKTLGLPK